MASYKVNPDITEQENFVTLVNISNNTSFKPNELTFSDIALIPGADITSTLQRNSTVRIVSTADSVYAVDNVVKYTKRFNQALVAKEMPDCTCTDSYDNFEVKFCRYGVKVGGSKVAETCCADSLINLVKGE